MTKLSKAYKMLTKLSPARKFNNYTMINHFESQTPSNTWPQEWKTVYYKAYPRFDQIILPLPSSKRFELFQALSSRISIRNFSCKPVSLKQLSNLLYYSVGLKRILVKTESESRMYPSAGARYPLEIYLFIFNVQNLENGVYHYHLKTHSLELIPSENMKSQALKQVNQEWLKESGFFIIPTAVFDRTEVKYKDRGYRHTMTEYGHIAQNVYLIGTALGLGVCSIGGFIDEGFNKILDLDGRTESIVGLIAIGSKKQ